MTTPAQAARLELVDVVKSYGAVLGVGPVTITVEPGQFVSLLGPSGCGKTTTLRVIAGLERPTAGDVRINGDPVNDVPPHRRNIGLVFQNYALFPHLTVFDNVAFGLRYRPVERRDVERRVREVLDLVNLHGLERRTPRELSGGQQQRVALARAIVISPSILLLDEPLSNLDMALRQRMQEEIKRIQREVGITTVYVTHDQNEAFAMSDRVAILFRGHLHQYAEPSELYERPATGDVAGFIGEMNYLDGQLSATSTGPRFTTDRGTVLAVVADAGLPPVGRHRLAVRPHRVRLAASVSPSGAVNVLEARVEQANYSGDMLRLIVRLAAGDLLRLHTPNFREVRRQLETDAVRIELRPEDLQFLPAESTARRA